MDIQGKNIIVTGASSGFGKALLDKLVSYTDTRIIAVARKTDEIPTHNGRIIPYSADLSKQQDVDKLFDFARGQFGLIDIFIANAGFAYYEKIKTADWQHIQNIFDVNVISPIYSLQKMIETQPTHKMSFVMVASAGGLVALPGFTLYSSTKFAVNGFAETYKYERDKNINYTVVYPVAARTNFFNHSAKDTPIPYPTQSISAVVKGIIRGIEKERRKIYPSKLFKFGYPFLRAFPPLLEVFMRKQKTNFDKWLRRNDN
mgnify:CR=1 FL=1